MTFSSVCSVLPEFLYTFASMTHTSLSSLSSHVHRSEDEVINFTLINLVLHLLGPMRERTLCILLLVSVSG